MRAADVVPVTRNPTSAPTHTETFTRAAADGNVDTCTGTSGRFLAVNGDTFDWVPDASIDLVLTDPPFNIAQDTNFHTWGKNTINSYRFDSGKGWDSHDRDDFILLLQQWASGFARVLRKGGSFAVFCADEYLSHFHEALQGAGLNVRRTLTWRKPNAVPINRKTMMMSACEYVLVGVKGSKATFNADLPADSIGRVSSVEEVLVADKAAVLVEKKVREAVAAVSATPGERPSAVAAAAARAVRAAEAEIVAKVAAMYTGDGDGVYLRGCVPNQVNFTSKGGVRLHPTEKPVTLLTYLIQLLSNEGDVVLDPFAGSGSAGEAAMLHGRYPILVEADTEYYQAAEGRLKNVEESIVRDVEEYRLFD